MLRNFPRNFRACVLWVRKNPGKFPPNFPLNFPNFPAKNQKKFTNELLQERRKNKYHFPVNSALNLEKKTVGSLALKKQKTTLSATGRLVKHPLDRIPWKYKRKSVVNPFLLYTRTNDSASAKYHTKGCSHSCADSPGARTLVFAAFEPFHSCEFRASIARTPFCAILWRSPNDFKTKFLGFPGPGSLATPEDHGNCGLFYRV